MTARPRRLPRGEHGFVLVGVIIFVLALTILALSLYGLSGFEAQFLEQNVAHDQAFYRAESGQELVKELLSQTLPDSSYYLQNAHKAIGIEGVVDATAWQMNGAIPITTGLVDWSGPVFIQVKAAYGGETRTVEGKYIGAPRRDPYLQLITSSNWIRYGDNNQGQGLLPFANRIGTVSLTGRVWQDSTVAPDVSWQSVLNWTSGAPVIRDRAPTPDAAAFIAKNLPTAIPVTYSATKPTEIDLTADPADPRGFSCFVGPPTSLNVKNTPYGQAFSLFDQVTRTIQVSGTCVWLFPSGVRFDLAVNVQKGPGPTGTLIVVGSPNNNFNLLGQYGDRAIWFFLSLSMQPNVNVYLVSDGVTDIEDSGGQAGSCSMNQLCVFSNGLWFLGPAQGHGTWSMQYASGMDALAQQLESLGALPASGGLPTSTFTLVPGSWREP